MISNAKSKLIRSLRQKKFRDQHGLYLAEGDKVVLELINHPVHHIEELFTTPDWITSHRDLLTGINTRVTETTPGEIKKVSNLITPQDIIALVQIPGSRTDLSSLVEEPVLGFESVRDPGNLGTIIRTADWFGIRHLVCTPDSVDLYNPKVVQSTMGSMARVMVHYLDPKEVLEWVESNKKPVCGTFLRGESIYGAKLPESPLILFGNESRGLTDQFDGVIGQRLSIPSFPGEGTGSESLNLAASVAVVCSEFRRRG
jgi:TrmH family RNA methyltransferase